MKRYLQITWTGIITMLFFSLGLNAATIEGVWKSDRQNVEMLVEKTYTGIKTKRYDQNEWFYYDKTGNNKYEDYRGNSYRFKEEGELVWRSANGKQTVKFYKSYVSNDDRFYEGNNDRDRDRNRDRDRDRDDYYADRDNDYNGNQRGNRFNVERRYSYLDGSWYNQKNGTKMKIRLEPNYLKIKVNRKWKKFYPSSRYSFSDGKGNRITILSDGRLRIKNRYGHRSSLYSKRRPVAYCY